MFEYTFRYLTFIGLLTVSLQAQTISLESFLEQVKSSHPFFEKENISPEIERKTSESLLGAEDWLLNASAHVSRQRPVSSSVFAPTEVNALGYQIAAERQFWRTGGRLSVGWTYDALDQNIQPIMVSGFGDIPIGSSQFFQNNIFARYIHPLRQNNKGKLDRLEYELQEFSIQLSEIQAQENKEEFLLRLAARFLDWVLVDQQIEIAKERQQLAEEQLQWAKERRAVNLIDEVDVLRAEDAIRRVEQNTLLLQTQWKALQTELATLAQSQHLPDQSPEYDLYTLVDLPPKEAVVSGLTEKSRLLQLIEMQRRHLEHLRSGQMERLKSRLDLIFDAGLLTGDNEFTDAIIPTRENLSVAVRYRVPFGKRVANAQINKTNLQIKQLNSDKKNVELELKAAISNLLVQKSEVEKVLALNRQRIESAIKKTTEEMKRYRQGRGELTFVIQSRDNEQNARLIYAQNAKLYHDLILQFRALVDELLE